MRPDSSEIFVHVKAGLPNVPMRLCESFARLPQQRTNSGSHERTPPTPNIRSTPAIHASFHFCTPWQAIIDGSILVKARSASWFVMSGPQQRRIHALLLWVIRLLGLWAIRGKMPHILHLELTRARRASCLYVEWLASYRIR